MPNDIISEEEITGIVLNKDELVLEKDASEQLIATIIPSTAPPVTINWESSDTSIATVDSEGNVTAIEAGECIIIATVESFSVECSTRVKVSPTSISLNYSEITHIVSETDIEELVATLEPSDCTETTITWTSTNEDIVTYSGGLIYNGGYGYCVLTATDVEGHSDSCTFTVYIRAEKPEPPTVSLVEQTKIVLEEIPNGEYSIDMGATWQSSNTFNNLETNKVYYFVQRTKDHDYVKESPQSEYTEIRTKDIVHVESVELNAHELDINLDNESGSFNFITTVFPEDAAIKNVYYSLNNTSIAFIDSNGKFRALNYGECTVTVTSIDGRKTDTCNITISKKWETPSAPIITGITKNSITVITDNLTVFSLDGGNVWQRGPVINGLIPKTSYNIICKTLADGLRNESDVSPKTFFITPQEDPNPYDPNPISITLSAHNLNFDLSNNTYTTLLYTIVPLDIRNNNVIWYTDNSSVISVGSGGEINAVGTGKAKVYVRTIAGGKTDSCDCVVYKTHARPDPPTLKEITNHTIEIYPVEGCEYSIDEEEWVSNTLFGGLNKNTYYTLYQRYKGSGQYEPASESSYGLTVKTLTDETPGGESESGYTWGQEVDCLDIPVFSSPYNDKSTFNISGRYYIFNLIECNHRIRVTRIYDYVGVYGHATGWVNIADLKLIEKAIYVGDKVIVNGDINIYADGSGIFIHENNQTMYITDIIEGQEYCYGVTSKPGLNRQGFAKEDQVIKYKSIII